MSSRAHPEADGLAMQEARVGRFRFQRVSHRMAEVQHAPQPALALVRGHDPGLQSHRVRDQPLQRRRIAP
jgi:hypothetical protein